MRQFLAVLRFELAFRRRHSPLYIFGGLCFTMSFLIVGIKGGMDAFGGVGMIAVNSPVALQQMMLIFSILFGLVITTAFVAPAVNRDTEMGMAGLFFSTPLRKSPYFLGRFSGALIASWVMISGLALGALLASLMPWQDPERMVTVTLVPYAYSLAVFVFPNLMFVGALAFSVATLTRRIMFSYVAILGLIVLYSVTDSFMSDLDSEFITAISDPFGVRAYALATRYWTQVESNSLAAPFTLAIVVNRLVWVGVGALFLGGTLWRYNMALPADNSRGTQQEKPKAISEANVSAGALATQLPHLVGGVARSFGFQAQLFQLWCQTKVEIKGLLFSAPFIIIALFGIGNIVGGAFGIIEQLGTTTLPVTHLMLTVVSGGMTLFLFIVLVFYGGELIHREKRYKLAELYDSFPIPNWVPLLSKLFAMLGAMLVLLAVATATTVTYQLANGYTRIEPALYFTSLSAIQMPQWIALSVVAIVAQVVANNRFLGYLLMILLFVQKGAFSALDWEHHLYQFASYPRVVYSDMNGFGHFMTPRAWFSAYWLVFAVILVGFAELLWVRGTDMRLALRFRTATERFNAPRAWALAAASALFIGLGSFIFYNTNIVNQYLPSDEAEALQVRAEKEFKQYEFQPQPRVTAVSLDVDLYPRERRVAVRGTLHLINKTKQPISQLHVWSGDPAVEVARLDIPGATLKRNEPELAYRVYSLEQPMVPGAEMDIAFDYRKHLQGFANRSKDNTIVRNGTFFNSRSYRPHFGYSRNRELADPNKRADHELPMRPRMAKIDDLRARANTYISGDSDWISFEAEIATDLDQIAVAPGYLVREWVDGERRHFRYEMGAKILNFWSILSANYQVKRSQWVPEGGGDPVAIEIFFHEAHSYNIDKMVLSIQESLDYFTQNFSPYQHRQVRVLEFPKYSMFAQSFPNTIPYSEGLGFIADASDADAIDYVHYVTSHEVAHQWWAHQVIGANVQGGTLMSESLAQYSALMVMEKHYGPDKMSKFLKYELNRYLSARSREAIEEMPLLLVENQGYIHYRKGSLVFYALKSYLGEKVLNGALKDYLAEVAHQPPPYTVSTDLYAHLKRATPDRYQYLLEDMFEKITLYDNRAKTVTVEKRQDGRFEVTLELQIKKLYADGQGVETEAAALADWIEVGVYGEESDEDGETQKVQLYRKKHFFDGSTSELTVVVDSLPTEAGIDPRNLLIDREPKDNRKAVAQGD